MSGDVGETTRKQVQLQEAYQRGLEDGKKERADERRQVEVRELATRIPAMEIDIKHVGCIKLTELIDAWEILHQKDTGDVGFCDLEAALHAAGVVVVNDVEEQDV